MYWSRLCDVDASALTAWLETAGGWTSPVSDTKPQRIHSVPPVLLATIHAQVLLCLPDGATPYDPMLSRMKPGQQHGLHVDRGRCGWITRVHVPLTTNPGAWLLFEGEGTKVHFEVGGAYSFNMQERHAFGNDGETDRVHLLFDVSRDG